jgi:predicted transglutaminase-like cysteine proteinase
MKTAGRGNGMVGSKAARQALTPARLIEGLQSDAAAAGRPAADPAARPTPTAGSGAPGRPAQAPWSGPDPDAAVVTPPSTVALVARLAAACLLMVGISQTAFAADAPWGRLDERATGRAAPAPAGWLNRCMADPAPCRASSERTEIDPTSAAMALIGQVQREVNRRIVPRNEPPGRDLWELAPTAGDCEDYALTKQARLRAAGLPAASVRLATVRLESGEHHAVATVETTRGTLVLDNLRPDPMPLASLNYRWLRVEDPGHELRWKELQGDPAGTTLQLSFAAVGKDDRIASAAVGLPGGGVHGGGRLVDAAGDRGAEFAARQGRVREGGEELLQRLRRAGSQRLHVGADLVGILRVAGAGNGTERQGAGMQRGDEQAELLHGVHHS